MLESENLRIIYAWRECKVWQDRSFNQKNNLKPLSKSGGGWWKKRRKKNWKLPQSEISTSIIEKSAARKRKKSEQRRREKMKLIEIQYEKDRIPSHTSFPSRNKLHQMKHPTVFFFLLFRCVCAKTKRFSFTSVFAAFTDGNNFAAPHYDINRHRKGSSREDSKQRKNKKENLLDNYLKLDRFFLWCV